MVNFIDKMHALLTRNKPVVIIIILLGIAGTLASFWQTDDNPTTDDKNFIDYKGAINPTIIINPQDNDLFDLKGATNPSIKVDVNQAKPNRNINEEFIIELNKILPTDKNKEIFFGVVPGDQEARNFALEIKEYLKSAGRNTGAVDNLLNPRCVNQNWNYGYKDWGDNFEIQICKN